MRKIGLITAALLLTACQNPPTPPYQTPETPSQSEVTQAKDYGAYMIVTGRNYNPKDLGPYAASLPPIYAKYGGEYVVFTTEYVILEGEYTEQAVIISGWPDVKSAQDFWTGPEYSEAIKLRDGIGEFTVIVVPALPAR